MDNEAPSQCKEGLSGQVTLEAEMSSRRRTMMFNGKCSRQESRVFETLSCLFRLL